MISAGNALNEERRLRRKAIVNIRLFYLVFIYLVYFYCWLYILKDAVMCFEKKKKTTECSEYSTVENKMKNQAEDGS